MPRKEEASPASRHLRSIGLIALRHCAVPASAAAAAPPPALLVRADAGAAEAVPEPDLQPTYDVYARDGISTFKLATPGPPDFYVCVASADDAPPSPAQMMRLDAALACHMAALREQQQARGIVPQPSFNELGGGGGGGGGGGAPLGRASNHMSRAAAEAAGGSAFTPNIKIAIVSHTTVTFYAVTPVELRLPRRYAQQQQRQRAEPPA